MRSADRAWLILGVSVVVYEVAAEDGELLSEACDRYLANHPWLTRTIVGALALHLINAVPPALDPIHQLFAVKRRLNSRPV